MAYSPPRTIIRVDIDRLPPWNHAKKTKTGSSNNKAQQLPSSLSSGPTAAEDDNNGGETVAIPTATTTISTPTPTTTTTTKENGHWMETPNKPSSQERPRSQPVRGEGGPFLISTTGTRYPESRSPSSAGARGQNRPLSCRARLGGRSPPPPPLSSSSSSRSKSRLDSRPTSSRPSSLRSSRPPSSRPGSCSIIDLFGSGSPDSRQRNSRTPSATGRRRSGRPGSRKRALSAKAWSRSPSPSRTRRSTGKGKGGISATSKGLAPRRRSSPRSPSSRHGKSLSVQNRSSSARLRSPSAQNSLPSSRPSSSRPQSLLLSRRPASYSSSSRTGCRSENKSPSSRSGSESEDDDRNHLSSARPPCPEKEEEKEGEGREVLFAGTDIGTEGRKRSRGGCPERKEGRRRPQSSQIQDGSGRMRWSSGVSRGTREGNSNNSSSSSNNNNSSNRKGRPWTAPVAGRSSRCRDDFPDRAGDGGWMVPDQYSDETKRRQEEIIRRILEEFDLEETMRKYRNSNAQSYRPTGTGLQDYQFRSELLRLMGTEEIRLNDQEWNTRFKEKLTEDYERLLDRQEENLAYAETRRMHRLRVEGILPEARKEDDDLGSYFNLRLSQMALEAAPSSSTSTKKKQGKRGGPASSTSDWESKAIFTKDESNQREKTMRTRRHEKVYHPSEDVQTQVAKEKQTITEEDEELEGSSMDDADALVQTAVKDELEEAKESIERHRQKRLDRMPPNIRRLYEEETISGLYKIAQDLVLAESNARNPPRKGVKPE